jgi:hypothetical protein
MIRPSVADHDGAFVEASNLHLRLVVRKSQGNVCTQREDTSSNWELALNQKYDVNSRGHRRRLRYL